MYLTLNHIDRSPSFTQMIAGFTPPVGLRVVGCSMPSIPGDLYELYPRSGICKLFFTDWSLWPAFMSWLFTRHLPGLTLAESV